MLAGLEGGLGEGVVGVVRGADDDELDVGVGEHVGEGAVDLGGDAEAGVELAAGGRGGALEDGVEGEEVGEGEDEGGVEGEAREPDAQDTGVDGFDHGE